MSSMRKHMETWLGIKPDISTLGSSTCACESGLRQEIEPKWNITPWEMTQDAYTDKMLQQVAIPAGDTKYRTIVINQFNQQHRAAVLKALGDELPVPDEVLADYPDIVKSRSRVTSKVVKLGELQAGDRFIIEGLLIEREILRKEGYHAVTRRIDTNEIESIPTNTQVRKTGHRPVGPPSVCDGLPNETRQQMIDISRESEEHTDKVNDIIIRTPREMGAIITDDYVLGDTVTGQRDRINIPRKTDQGSVVGTFHSHPGGNTMPGDFDLIDMLDHNDQIQCICATHTLSGTKCQCYTQGPKFQEMRQVQTKLIDDIRQFNKKTRSKYGLKGKSLRKLLYAVGSEAYLRGELPYSVTQIPIGKTEAGGRKPMTERQVTGTTPISIDIKRATNQEMIHLDNVAKQAESTYEAKQAEVDNLVNQINDKLETVESLKGNAIGDGKFITIYHLDRVNNLTEIENIRHEVLSNERAFKLSEIPFEYYTYGNESEYRRLSNALRDVDTGIGTTRRALNALYTSPYGSNAEQEEALDSRLDELWQQRGELVSGMLMAKPFVVNQPPELTLVIVDEKQLPIDQNDAAEGLSPMQRTEAIALIERRATEIKHRDEVNQSNINRLKNSLEGLWGKVIPYVGLVGGRAQQYRDIAEDRTKSDTERANATIHLDVMEKQAKQIRKLLSDAKRNAELAQTSKLDTKVVKFGPDIEGLIVQIEGLSKQVNDRNKDLTSAFEYAENARGLANEKRAEFDIMAKDRVAEFNEAVTTVKDGENLEARRLAYLNKLREYEKQTGLKPEELATKKDRLLDSCRLIWEEETLTMTEREQLFGLEDLLPEV